MSNNNNIPEQYRPISMWGYFGYEILFSIPLVGFIILLICAFGSGNVNVRNFARSYFCFLILVLVISIVIAAIVIATGSAVYFQDILSVLIR
ncbi:MAG: hypothetical protein J5685_03000 [Clostridiales bacterium]|nr:hypothetical protein [Clostridiales bacterium]